MFCYFFSVWIFVKTTCYYLHYLYADCSSYFSCHHNIFCFVHNSRKIVIATTMMMTIGWMQIVYISISLFYIYFALTLLIWTVFVKLPLIYYYMFFVIWSILISAVFLLYFYIHSQGYSYWHLAICQNSFAPIFNTFVQCLKLFMAV